MKAVRGAATGLTRPTDDLSFNGTWRMMAFDVV
jgi:hypothetical protein